MKTKSQKKESLKLMMGKLAKSKITIFAGFAEHGQQGLNVSKMTELRRSLRPLKAEFHVEKKTLLDKAVKDSKLESDVLAYTGSLGVAYGSGDALETAKAMYAFSKKSAVFKLFGGFMDGKYVDDATLIELAKLPSKEVLLGRLVGILSYPMRGLAVALNQRALQL